MLEEARMTLQNEEEDSNNYYRVYNQIPFSLISEALEEDNQTSRFMQKEFNEINKAYQQFEKGVEFTKEGSNNDYVASDLKFKNAATLIKKEARFIFGITPDIKASILGMENTENQQMKKALNKVDNLITKVINDNMFQNKLLQGAKDCFIGKRIALLANFNEQTGITLEFITSQNFVYRMRNGSSNILEKITIFSVLQESSEQKQKRIFKKTYELVNEGGKDVCYLEEAIYDGAGQMIEEQTKRQPILLNRIPCVVILNDALTGDIYGVSEMLESASFEEYFNKLSNSDIDSERKGMHQIRYTVDMSEESTRGLSSAPGSFWDLQSDENKDNLHPSVGSIAPDMSYSNPLESTLKRIKQGQYDMFDIPNITPENMVGTITSGKAMQILYWPLLQRANEKMKVWGPALSYIFKVVIEGAIAYPKVALMHVNDDIQVYDYEVKIEYNSPLPQDEEEEKTMDIAEVQAQIMSRKSYMKKWRLLSDKEADEELKQIALERQLLEDSQFNTDYNDDSQLYE